ncbi:MAG: ABC transporter substrate-binding protein [Planctomycetota bacterium]|jgi:iron complex transport system substrate-binding protein
MNKNLIIILVLTIVVSAGVLAVTFLGGDDRPTPPSDTDDAGPRIVTLTPGITETVFAIGADKDVVGISDFSNYPPESRELPTLGSSLAPSFESIAKLEPSLILADNSRGAKKDELSALGNAHFLDWLTIEQVTASTRRIGELTGRKDEAEILAKKYEAMNATPEAMNAPTVLAVIAGAPGKLGPVYYIRRNSLHGVMLRAAGGKNAVAEDIPVGTGASMSIEKVLEIQPDVILIMSSDGEMKSGVKDAHVAEWMKLETLYAVDKSRVAVVAIDGLTLPGPRVFDNIPKLKSVIDDLMK